MSEQADESDHMGIPRFVITDMQSRIQHLEINIPPRVQALEMAVSEISGDLRGIREELREARKENRDSVHEITHALEGEQGEIRRQASNTNDKLTTLGKRITFASGAAWAITGLVVFAIYNWKVVAEFIVHAQAML